MGITGTEGSSNGRIAVLLSVAAGVFYVMNPLAYPTHNWRYDAQNSIPYHWLKIPSIDPKPDSQQRHFSEPGTVCKLSGHGMCELYPHLVPRLHLQSLSLSGVTSLVRPQ